MEEADERAFLFGGEHGTNAYRFTLRAAGVYEDLLGALHQLERPDRPLGVGCFFGDLPPDGHELSGGDNCHGMIATLDLTLVGALEGGADGDNPTWTQHLQLQIGVVGDVHELCVAWMS